MTDAHYWHTVQQRGRELGAYDGPAISDSILINPSTGLPMDEKQARAYIEIMQKTRDQFVRDS